jgi:hypothetical protein
METHTQRGLRLLQDQSISEALSYICTCKPNCTEKWSRSVIRNARQNYLGLPLSAQMQRIYDILLSCYNAETNDMHLFISGLYSLCFY